MPDQDPSMLSNSDDDLRVPEWSKRELGAKPAHRRDEEKVAASDVSGDEDLLREIEGRTGGA